MSVNPAVRHLNQDLGRMHAATRAQAKDQASEKKAASTEKSARAQIAQQTKQLVDQFQSGTLDPSQQKAALDQLFALGEKDQKAVDTFKTAMTHARSALSHDKKAFGSARHQALKDLKPAEYHLGLKQTNQDRKALGLKPLKQALTDGGKGADAVKVARSVLGHDTQQLKYSGPIAKYLNKAVNDHVCCANFVSACLEKAGLIKPSEHSDMVTGLASNLAHDKNWQRVGTSNLKPGDVVCFTVPGEGHYAHVEMFNGYHNGVPTFIGSNNVNADGSQRVSVGSPGYHIDAVYRHKG